MKVLKLGGTALLAWISWVAYSGRGQTKKDGLKQCISMCKKIGKDMKGRVFLLAHAHINAMINAWRIGNDY